MTVIPHSALEAVSETDEESFYEFDLSDFFDTSTRVPLNVNLFQPAEESGSSQNDEYLGGEDYVDLGDIGDLVQDEYFRNALLSGASWPSTLDSPPSIQVTGPSPASTTFARQPHIGIHGAQISAALLTPSNSVDSHKHSYMDTIRDTASVTSSRDTFIQTQPDTWKGTNKLSQWIIQIETPETLRHRFHSEPPVRALSPSSLQAQGHRSLSRVSSPSNTSERTINDAKAQHTQPGERTSSIISVSARISPPSVVQERRASSNRKGKRKRDPEPELQSSPEPFITNPPIVPSMGFDVPAPLPGMSNALDGGYQQAGPSHIRPTLDERAGSYSFQHQNPPAKRQRTGIARNTRSQHQEAPVDIPIDPRLLLPQQGHTSHYHHARQARPTLTNHPIAQPQYHQHRQMGELVGGPAYNTPGTSAINPNFGVPINGSGPTQGLGYYPQQAFGSASHSSDLYWSDQWAMSNTGAAYSGSYSTPSTTGNAVASSSRVRLDMPEQANHWEYVGEFADVSRAADARGYQIPGYAVSSAQEYYAHEHGHTAVTHAYAQARGVNPNATNSRRPQQRPHSSRKGKGKKGKQPPIPSEPAKVKRKRPPRDARIANIPKTRCIIESDEPIICKYDSCGMETTYAGAQSHLEDIHGVKPRNVKGGGREQCLNCEKYLSPCSLGRHICEIHMPPYIICGVPGCPFKNKRRHKTTKHYLDKHYPTNPEDPFP